MTGQKDELPRESRVWLLRSARTGDNNQLAALAQALTWPSKDIDVEYNTLFCCPNWLLGASRASVRALSCPLAAPWPDVVIGIGRRSVPLARWIQRQSGGRSRLVQLGRPRAPLDWFDLVVTTPQYGLPELANVLCNPLPLPCISESTLSAAHATWAPELTALPAPRLALMVGGPTWAYRLDTATARVIARRADDAARAAGGSLLVTTSPRTPAAVAAALAEEITAPAHVYRWDRDASRAHNPFLGYLALADSFMVTMESVSLLAETCATGRPVTVLPLPRRPGVEALEGLARPVRRARYEGLTRRGIFTPPRRIASVHEELVRLGLARWAGDTLEVSAPPNGRFDPVQRTLARIRDLMGAAGTPDRPAATAAGGSR